MHTDYTRLTENHIGVWSVKTDAFVIRKEHLRRAKNLIEFSDRIGGWRHKKSKNIAEPTEQWAPKKNELIAIPVFNNETRPIENEWDTESIAKDIGTHILNRIRECVKKNPNKIIIGAGDVKQLPPIEDLTNTRKPDEYADECINQIFKYNVMLTICKRLGQQGDPTAEANRKC